MTPFQAHYPNNPLSNISTVRKSSNLTLEQLLNHYLDADTVLVEDYLDENGWVPGDILLEEGLNNAQVYEGRRNNYNKNKSVSRFILHPVLTNPITSEMSFELKRVQKATKRSKKDLR